MQLSQCIWLFVPKQLKQGFWQSVHDLPSSDTVDYKHNFPAQANPKRKSSITKNCMSERNNYKVLKFKKKIIL